ncbi:MAG: THUMP domain-containing protein [Nanoarchaeota archaeon]|nr:THUMP domain-containing protein [Nanoarchaeota archaeon]
MKYIAICAKGLEDITQLEIKELIKVESLILIPGRIVFETTKVKTLIEKSQSIIKIYELKQECKSIDEIKSFKLDSTFRIRCSRIGEHDFRSLDIEKDIGEKFFQAGNIVDLKNPQMIIFIDIVDDNYFVGINLTPELLSKREYRIKIHNQSINACIAYGLVRLSDFNAKKLLVDPFPKDGVIVIEASLYKKGMINAFASEFRDVRNVEINSKLAGIRKDINMSRIEVEWLDTKFGKEEVDCVVSTIPYPSKSLSEKEVKKLYKELWHQLDFIVKKKGKVVFISPKVELLKEMNKTFKIVEEREVATSKLNYYVVIFSK